MALRPTLILAMLLWLALPACQATQELGQEFDPRAQPAQVAYEQAIAPYQAQAALRQGPATELLAKALPLTTGVRRAMLEREATALDLSPQRRQAREADHQAEAAQGLKVALSLYVPDKKLNDLTAQRPSWRVFLLTPQGQRLEPTGRRLIKKRTPLLEAFYPFWGLWDRLYYLTFALPPGVTRAELVITGAPGKASLPLKLD